ncbi:SRPBCC domain-containing protein [Bradyrhizobium lablabi]|uniref:SRPBCC family protein n=1 Tax=Bradyrhizobium lablabi TaxID=722472 RepID=UPI001BA4C9C7|nr:SRPBCC domain-containing protein [Bradyrhizobium lablabi]MBR0696101.1 SRPBCC domain-containing protein [Bradyrhizobium lablabi]
MTEPLVVRRELQIAAPPATVFAFLTDPEKIVSWMGLEATTETHPGGLYLLKGIGGSRARVARGKFHEVVPVHRLAYSFGWEDGEEVPPGSSLIEIDLVDKDNGTLLRMTHSGLPNAAQCESHAKGWAHYLGRLAVVASGRHPGPDIGPAQST